MFVLFLFAFFTLDSCYFGSYVILICSLFDAHVMGWDCDFIIIVMGSTRNIQYLLLGYLPKIRWRILILLSIT